MDSQLIFDFKKIHDDNLLKSGVEKICGDSQAAIPLMVRLIENPASPVALPGKIDLYNHDCLHLLLNRGGSLFDEAFIIGFTMGNDDNTNSLHVKVFKFFSSFVYPNSYQFNQEHFQVFDLGFQLGKKLLTRNINQIDFRETQYQEKTIAELRTLFKIDLNELTRLKQVERQLTTQSWSGTTIENSVSPQLS